MKTIDDIRTQLSLGQFEFSRHAFKRAVERNISEFEIRQAGGQARIIEDYPRRQVCSKLLAARVYSDSTPSAYPGVVCRLRFTEDHYDL